jgi:3-oxoacyl-[acyl-carrier protein] reductase
MDLSGKAALVTGGGTGVGRATALALARRGCAVAVNYSRSKEDAERTAADVTALGVRGLAVRADVADDAACRALVATAVRELGGLQVLVCSAGTTRFIGHRDLDAVDDEAWDQIFAVNLKGPFHCARAVRAAMEEAGEGEIVHVSSIAGLVGVGSSIPYCASKAALNNLTITLARALAPTIRVNAVAPGFITGRWLKGGLGDAYDLVRQHLESRAPLRKVCEPEDVAEAILALIAGPDLVTGQVLTIDGGMLLADPTIG